MYEGYNNYYVYMFFSTVCMICFFSKSLYLYHFPQLFKISSTYVGALHLCVVLVHDEVQWNPLNVIPDTGIIRLM